MTVPSGTDAPATPAVRLDALQPLVDALLVAGYTVIGPTVRDGAVVFAELRSADDLPYGVGVDVAPGRYRLRERGDRMAFGHAAGPQSAKTYLHPSRTMLFGAARRADGAVDVTAPEPDRTRYAFLGLRACDLRAVEIQQRVLGRTADTPYARARAAALVVAVNCTEPAATCFCVSAGGGPRAERGYDVALTELVEDGRTHYLAEPGSAAGAEILAALPTSPADEALERRARTAVAEAADRMGRALPDTDLRQLLAGTRDAARWDDVARRCLACGNCTMVCPTCFCTTVTDTTDVTGDHAERWQTWDSCFDLDFSYLHGGPVRPSVRGRYRQWLSHKLGTWHDQFGESGCVGCGRCVAWCPVGIDITEETNALAAGLGATAAEEGRSDGPDA